MTAPIRVAVTGAGGQIGYALIFRIASGGLFGPDQPVALQRFRDLVPNGKNGIQCGHRLLENHGNVAPAQLMQLSLGHPEYAAPFEQDLAAQPRRFDEPEQRECGDGLTRS